MRRSQECFTNRHGKDFWIGGFDLDMLEYLAAMLPPETLIGILGYSENTLRRIADGRRNTRIQECISILGKRLTWAETAESIDLKDAVKYLGITKSYKHIREQLTNGRITPEDLEKLHGWLTSDEIRYKSE